MFRFFAVLLFVFSLVGCGVGLEDSSGPNVDREIKNDKLRAEYDSVRGTYDGFIRLSDSNKRFPVKFYMWTAEVQEAPLPGDLKPGVRVVLRGRLIQQDFIGDSDNLIMTGQYDSVTGRLRLDPDLEVSKTSTGCRLGGQDPITVSANFNGSSVNGSILRNGQEWATLENARRISTDISSGSVLSEEQDYRRMEDTYRPVLGTFQGELMRQVCGTARKENFQLWLYIERVSDNKSAGNANATCYVPRLTLRTLRYYAGELADQSYRSLNRFDPERFLPQFNSNLATLNLDYNDGHLTGEIFTSGRWGAFNLVKTSEQVTAPEDESLLFRERLERTYQQFTGLYTGTNKAYSGPNWPVKLQLYTDEKNIEGVRTPILYALYTRPDVVDEIIGRRLMEVAVSIDGCKPLLAMKSEPWGGGGIPGVGLMRFSASYDNGSLEGELVDHRGPQGILSVKKR